MKHLYYIFIGIVNILIPVLKSGLAISEKVIVSKDFMFDDIYFFFQVQNIFGRVSKMDLCIMFFFQELSAERIELTAAILELLKLIMQKNAFLQEEVAQHLDVLLSITICPRQLAQVLRQVNSHPHLILSRPADLGCIFYTIGIYLIK